MFIYKYKCKYIYIYITRGYYAKWNKSVRERQIPHDFMYGVGK